MKVSERTIVAIGKIATGDQGVSPYRSGPQLVRLFNDYGSNDVYGKSFPSRWQYAEQKLKALNGTSALGVLLCRILDPREFMDTDYTVAAAREYVNKRLQYDGYEVVIEAGLAKLHDLKGVSVTCKHPFEGSEEEGHVFIDEQIKKAERKIQRGGLRWRYYKCSLFPRSGVERGRAPARCKCATVRWRPTKAL